MSSEKDIEQRLIETLKDLKYTYRDDITDKAQLDANFRQHFNRLNYVELSDAEFIRLKEQIITPDVFAASKLLRERNLFKREDDTPLDFTIVNTVDWCKNTFEVVNQLRMNTDSSHHRYDVIILLNGIPMVQIELKAHEVAPKRAMEQIVKYKNDAANCYTNSLLCFIQLFIVSNEHTTYYFSNNNAEHFSFNADERFLPTYHLADRDNKKIQFLEPFAQTLLKKCTLAQLISKYMVLVATEQKLMIMRSYQIYAVRAIVDCVTDNRGNGYIWHTTGSGKTLTSFKASTLLKDNPDIAKCLFVVDRKDLDKQTRDEFNKFQENCVEENTNTAELVDRLLSTDYADKIIVCTIQKLGIALDSTSKQNTLKIKYGHPTYKDILKPLADKRMVIIFDECHRSQFGETHIAIKKFFPNAQLFGFTGTPIFEDNASYTTIEGTTKSYVTTADIFQKQLHAYTITNAIDDETVLKFNAHHFELKSKSKTTNSSLPSKKVIVEEILNKHKQSTFDYRFNAIFATNSINDAIGYYKLFKKEQNKRADADPRYRKLNIACIFSPPTDVIDNQQQKKDIQQLQEELLQEKYDNQYDPQQKKQLLTAIIDDYNKQYHSNYNIYEFDSYYQDIQQRIKWQQYPNIDVPPSDKIDVVIVVDMLLTGFDSKYLNTIYVDKKLKHHHLIQALSRTNRIMNRTKPFGNVLDFRQQKDALDDAIRLFSGQEPNTARTIWLVQSKTEAMQQYTESVQKLEQLMAVNHLPCTPDQIGNLQGDTERINFMTTYREVQRLRNDLEQRVDLEQTDTQQIEAIMPQETVNGFRGAYLEMAHRYRTAKPADSPPADSIPDDELALFSSAIIDFDYIMSLCADYTQAVTVNMTRDKLISFISSFSNFQDEKDDIVAFVDQLKPGMRLTDQQVKDRYYQFRGNKQVQELRTMAGRHQLTPAALTQFVDAILDRKIFDGEKLTELMEPLGLAWRQRVHQEQALMAELAPLLRKRSHGQDIAGLSAYE